MEEERHLAAWALRTLAGGDLSAVEPSDVAALAGHLVVERYAGGTPVGDDDDDVPRVRMVHKGAIEVLVATSGREATVRILSSGDLMGDVELLLGVPRNHPCRALRDATVLAIDAVAWQRMVGTRPRLNQRWVLSMAERLSYVERRIGDLLAGDLECQLAVLLLRECTNGQIRLSQAALARLLGVQRSSINRVLRSLESQRLIDIGYRRIDIRDRDGLSALVG